jgi:hypothetical protein
MGLTWFRQRITNRLLLLGRYSDVATKSNQRILVANLSDTEDVTSELANEAADRMERTDQTLSGEGDTREVAHADYDPVASLTGGDADTGVALG